MERFTDELSGPGAAGSLCLSHGGPTALHEGSSSTEARVARSAHEPICKSRLQGGDIPAPDEGSLAQLMPVASILCWLTQRGVGQPAAFLGAWKRPSVSADARAGLHASRCPCTLSRYLPPNPALGCPTAVPGPTGPAGGRLAELCQQKLLALQPLPPVPCSRCLTSLPMSLEKSSCSRAHHLDDLKQTFFFLIERPLE